MEACTQCVVVQQVLDSNNSGVIEWPEFVYAIACLEKGSLEQRADFIFRVRTQQTRAEGSNAVVR